MVTTVKLDLTVTELELVFIEFNASVSCGAEDPEFETIRNKAEKALQGYRAACPTRALSEAQAANLDLVIARLEQIAGNFTDDYRNSAAEALTCARAIATTSAPVEVPSVRDAAMEEVLRLVERHIAFGLVEEIPAAIRALRGTPAAEALVCARAIAAEAVSVRYWMDGTKIVEVCLSKAMKAEHGSAPFPLNAEQAALWHRAQMEAYRHALEMMGVPGGDAIRALQGKPEAGGPRFTSERPDILHAIYKGFQRGDSVERVHFDVCALIKAGAK